MDTTEVTKNAALTPASHESSGSPELRSAIAQFCRRRSIEAASALSLIALTSFSQAWALSVNELNVESALGQPLRATLDIATSGSEVINARCLRLGTPSDAGMPGVSGVSLTVSTRLNGATVRFSGSKPLREPMSEMILNINCAGTPALSKSFLVMLDPPALAAAPVQAPVTTPAPTPAARPAVAARQRSAASTRSARTPIPAGGTYVVQPGDILSVIAARVEGRPDYSVWPIAQRIYDTNPAAFDSREPDSLRVGATLSIPALTGRLARAGSVNQVREVRLRRATTAPARKTQAPAQQARPAPRPAVTTKSTSAARAQPSPAQTVAPAAPIARAIVNRQPVLRRMSYAQDLSGLSLDRLRQRRAGTPFVVNLTANEAPPAPTPAPAPEAAAPVVAKTQEPVATATNAPTPTPAAAPRRSMNVWVGNGIALLLGALLGTLATGLGLRRWLAAQKEEQEAEIARAKRHQARLDESRQQRTSTAAPTIVVHEELPRVDISAPPTMDAIGSIDEIVAAGPSSAAIGTLLQEDAAAEETDPLSEDAPGNDGESSDPDRSLSVDAIDPEAELDYDVFEAPDEDDLELLARDYAESVTDLSELEPDIDLGATQALLSPEKLGMVDNATEIIPNPLDLELPQGNEDDTELSVAALRQEEVANAEPQTDDTVHDVADESTEAVIQLDAELLELAKALPQHPPQDNDPTAETELVNLDQGEDDTDPTTAIETRDSEDFYHLEASSIRKVDALAFEEELDDDDTQLVSVRN